MREDVLRIASVQALRAFGYGFASVLLGGILAGSGLDGARVGLVLAAILAGMGLGTLAVALVGERLGRRRVYVALLLLMGVAGAVFALTTWLPALIAAALTGTLSTDANESGPITSVEQAMLGQAPSDVRASVFARYNAVAFLSGSAGALASGGPSALHRLVPAPPPSRLFLLLLPALAIACAAVASRLSARVEAEPSGGRRPAGLHRSRRRVAWLAALFGADSFASGFVVQAFLSYWLQSRFHVGAEAVALVFFATGILQGVSALAAGPMARRIGLLMTMVASHGPANLVLAAVPLMPSFPLAAGALMLRAALSNMDTPARQAFVASVVEPDERTSAAALTNVVRYFVKPVAPLVGGALLRYTLAAPFFACAAIKIGYDAVLYFTMRNVRPEPAGSGSARPATRAATRR